MNFEEKWGPGVEGKDEPDPSRWQNFQRNITSPAWKARGSLAGCTEMKAALIKLA